MSLWRRLENIERGLHRAETVRGNRKDVPVDYEEIERELFAMRVANFRRNFDTPEAQVRESGGGAVSTVQHRVTKLEEATGLDGSGCPQCRGRKVVKVWQHEESEPATEYCPHCGRGLTVCVHIVYVKRELWECI